MQAPRTIPPGIRNSTLNFNKVGPLGECDPHGTWPENRVELPFDFRQPSFEVNAASAAFPKPRLPAPRPTRKQEQHRATRIGYRVSIAALIVAAGRGSRAASAGIPPKQYANLAGHSVLARSIAAFARHPDIACIQVVIHPDDTALYYAALGAPVDTLLPPVPGGATRQDSVRIGIEALAERRPKLVLIHDAARPFVDAEIVDRVIANLAKCPGAIAAVPESDTLKRIGKDKAITQTVDRSGLWRAQTPQGFHFDAIRSAHARAAASNRADFTDDAAIMEWAGQKVALVEGSTRNVKLTTAEDIEMARRLIENYPTALNHETRTGNGFDVHRFAPGTSVWLCGVEIPHVARLEGHSDADVGLHALTDAILGAIGAGDIGLHFPPPTCAGRVRPRKFSSAMPHALSAMPAAGSSMST